MPDDFIPQLSVKVAGAELVDDVYDRLTSVRAESSVQLPDLVTLRFIDADFELYDRQICKVGDQLEVSITSAGQPRTVADCDVTAIAVEPGDDGGMTLVVTAHGADHELYRGVGLATFVDQTDSDIASTIATGAGLQPSVDATSISHPHIMQMGPSNRFLDERAAAVGFRWWVDGRTLNFKRTMPTDAGPTLTWGDELLTLRMLATTADATANVSVRSWDPDTQESIVGSAQPTSSLDTIGTDATGPTAVANDGRTQDDAERFQASRPTDDASAAGEMARGIATRAAAAAVQLRGSALGDPRIKAGRTVEIANVGTRLSGKYHVARVEHVYEAGDGYITNFETGGQDATGLVDLLRPPPTPRAWDPGALVIGVVTNVSDPERPARVKVRFPTYSDTFESAWARLVLPGAGKAAGLQIYPDVGDEVLVGFEHGDPTRPVVVGGLWSKKLPPPHPNADVVADDLVAIRSWTSKAGHSITIRDTSAADPDSVIVELADGVTRLTLAQDRVILETPSDLTIKTDANASITAQGDLELEATNVSIKASSKLDLVGAQVTAKGKASVSIDGPTVDVKASAKVAVDGGGLAQIKGGMVQLN